MTPLVILTVNVMMVPLLVLYGTQGRLRFIPYVLAPLIILVLLFRGQSVPLLLVTLFFLIPAVAMGDMYRRDAPARNALTAGVLAFIGEMLAALLLSYAFEYNVIREMQKMLWNQYYAMPPILQEEISEDIMDLTIRMMIQLIPLFMIGTGIYYAAITHALGHRLLKHYGVPARSFPPVRQWMLPKSLVFIYLVVLFLDLFIAKSFDSMLTTILLNGVPLLMAAFTVQALSFLLYVAHYKRSWTVILPVMGILAIPIMPNLLSLLGVFDVAFPLRRRIQS